MRAMKESILAKSIDLDKYKDRFGTNYPNDKRKMKDSDITLNMIERMCKNLDIKLDYGAFPDRPYDSPCIYGDTTKINHIIANKK